MPGVAHREPEKIPTEPDPGHTGVGKAMKVIVSSNTLPAFRTTSLLFPIYNHIKIFDRIYTINRIYSSVYPVILSNNLTHNVKHL